MVGAGQARAGWACEVSGVVLRGCERRRRVGGSVVRGRQRVSSTGPTTHLSRKRPQASHALLYVGSACTAWEKDAWACGAYAAPRRSCRRALVRNSSLRCRSPNSWIWVVFTMASPRSSDASTGLSKHTWGAHTFQEETQNKGHTRPHHNLSHTAVSTTDMHRIIITDPAKTTAVVCGNITTIATPTREQPAQRTRKTTSPSRSSSPTPQQADDDHPGRSTSMCGWVRGGREESTGVRPPSAGTAP